MQSSMTQGNAAKKKKKCAPSHVATLTNIEGATVRFSTVDLILRTRYACLTGGRALTGSPIIYLPDKCVIEATPPEHDRVIKYLISLLPLQEVDIVGVVLVADRRNGKWSAVKDLIDGYSVHMPAYISKVYILRPTGLLQNVLGLIKPVHNKSSSRSGANERVAVLGSLEELYRCIDVNELTFDLGGTLSYNHEDWMDQAQSVDQLSVTCVDVANQLDAVCLLIRQSHESPPISSPSSPASGKSSQDSNMSVKTAIDQLKSLPAAAMVDSRLSIISKEQGSSTLSFVSAEEYDATGGGSTTAVGGSPTEEVGGAIIVGRSKFMHSASQSPIETDVTLSQGSDACNVSESQNSLTVLDSKSRSEGSISDACLPAQHITSGESSGNVESMIKGSESNRCVHETSTKPSHSNVESDRSLSANSSNIPAADSIPGVPGSTSQAARLPLATSRSSGQGNVTSDSATLVSGPPGDTSKAKDPASCSAVEDSFSLEAPYSPFAQLAHQASTQPSSEELDGRLQEAFASQGDALQRLDQAVAHAEFLISRLRQPRAMGANEDRITVTTSGGRVIQYRHMHLKAIQRWILHLEDARKNFMSEWKAFERDMALKIAHRKLVERYLNIYPTVVQHLDQLKAYPEYADSLYEAEILLEDLNKLDSDASVPIGQAEDLLLDRNKLIGCKSGGSNSARSADRTQGTSSACKGGVGRGRKDVGMERDISGDAELVSRKKNGAEETRKADDGNEASLRKGDGCGLPGMMDPDRHQDTGEGASEGPRQDSHEGTSSEDGYSTGTNSLSNARSNLDQNNSEKFLKSEELIVADDSTNRDCPQSHDRGADQKKAESTGNLLDVGVSKAGLEGAESDLEAGSLMGESDRESCPWEEFRAVCQLYKSLMDSRHKTLRKSISLHRTLEEASQWCSRGLDLLEKLKVDGFTVDSDDTALQAALDEIDSFTISLEPLRGPRGRDFRAYYCDALTPATNVIVQGAMDQIDAVLGVCSERRRQLDAILQVALAPPTIVKAPAAEPQPISDKNVRRESGPFKRSSLQPQLNHMHVPRDYETLETGTIRRKRGHVIQELIGTERMYTKELSNVLEGYAEQWNNADLRALIPQRLIGKRQILFGNMDSLYKFHSETFLGELENCEETPSLVGPIFVKHRSQFMMYATYCLNKVNADRLIAEVGQDNRFLVECQRSLGHRLPLSSYLLKPVQRITKYHLLLKELSKFSSMSACEQLKEAVTTMCDLLKYVNNIMHQQSIVGYQGDLTGLGLLLMQGPVEVITGRRKDKAVLPDVRSKVMHRHIFLYERAVMFCKRREDFKSASSGVLPAGLSPGAGKQSSGREVYAYKSSLQTDQIGLTESPRGSDGRRFELWVQGRSDVYTIAAPTAVVKQEWVNDINKVLMNQFHHIKDSSKRNRSQQANNDSMDVPGASDSDFIVQQNNNNSNNMGTGSISSSCSGNNRSSYCSND